MINNIYNSSSAFYLPTYSSKEKEDYFYNIFKQALENGYASDQALLIAMKEVNTFPQKNKRKVEHNEKTDNNTDRRK